MVSRVSVAAGGRCGSLTWSSAAPTASSDSSCSCQPGRKQGTVSSAACSSAASSLPSPLPSSRRMAVGASCPRMKKARGPSPPTPAFCISPRTSCSPSPSGLPPFSVQRLINGSAMILAAWPSKLARYKSTSLASISSKAAASSVPSASSSSSSVPPARTPPSDRPPSRRAKMDRMFPTTSALIPVLSALGRKLPRGQRFGKTERLGCRQKSGTNGERRAALRHSQLFWTFS